MNHTNLQQRKIARILFDEFHNESWSIDLPTAQRMQPTHPADSSYALAGGELAQRDFVLERNLHAPLTMATLQQADVLLASIHDQRLFNIRQEIAKELVEIQATPTPDIAGLLSQLDAAIELIPNLPLKAAIDQIDKKNTTT